MFDHKTLSRRLVLGGAIATLGVSLLARRALAQSVDEVKKRGKVVIGIQGDNPPWGFVDASGGQSGFDADVGNMFGAYLGVPVEFMPLAVVNRIPALTTGRCDLLFATMAMLPDRAKAVQFSKPYAGNAISLVAAKSTEIKTKADMKNVVIGVPRASSQDGEVTKNAPEGTTIRRFDDDAATIQALLSGQVAAVGANMFYVSRLDVAKPGEFENKIEFSRNYNGACTRLGDKDMNTALNAFIDKIIANGDLAKPYQKWMHMDPPTFPTSIEGVPFTVS